MTHCWTICVATRHPLSKKDIQNLVTYLIYKMVSFCRRNFLFTINDFTKYTTILQDTVLVAFLKSGGIDGILKDILRSGPFSSLV